MRAKTFNEHVPTGKRLFPQAWSWLRNALGLLALCGFFAEARGYGAEPSLTETQVKSLFLLNFAKYVEWPADAFVTSSAPIIIGLVGDSKLVAELARTVEGKRVDGRSILILPIQTPEDCETCHILFLGGTEKTALVEILNRIKMKPVLTVGETDQFLEQGGVIRFAKKEGKVRLEINLEAARQANLQISSRLLNVADVVKGKLK
jgi:hypothetical protein